MDIRPTTEQDFDVFVGTLHTAFGRFPETPVDGGGLWWSAIEPDRALLARVDGRPVGTAAAYSFELTLPGATIVPAAGITAVGVVPTHRRRGVLSAMMRRQLTGLRERGEVLSCLLCTETTIYGRFGYGPATYSHQLTVPRHKAAFRGGAGEGRVELMKREDAAGLLEDVYDRYRRTLPGALSRPHRWWARRAGQPPVSGAPRHIAVHRDADGTALGYASYSLTEPSTLTVDEIVAADDTALVRFLLGHDLVTEVTFKNLPVDHPLRWQLADFRAARVSDDGDWLWVRLLDVPRALTARGWFADGDLVLDVDDPFLGEHGRWQLSVRDGKAECVPTGREPDLSLDIRDLGAIYLGGTTPGTLVRAGHVRAHHPAAAARADALFRGERAPHCVHWF